MHNRPKVTLVAVTSLDGYIGQHAKQLSFEWNSKEDQTHFANQMRAYDWHIVGRQTFDMHEPHMKHMRCAVLTRTVDAPEHKDDKTVYLNPEKTDVIGWLAEQDAKEVSVMGGSQIYSWAVAADIVDRMLITIEPIVFGDGLPLFNIPVEEKAFRLKDKTPLNANGTLLMDYERLRSSA